MIKCKAVSEVKVELIAGGGKCYTDVAARFCRSKKSVDEILGSEYSHNLVKHIVESGHLAATEFDTYIFGIDGASRVFEAQLIRKRIGSYMISSGGVDRSDSLQMVLPDDPKFLDVKAEYRGEKYNTIDILNILDSWYSNAIKDGVAPMDARYLLPQATGKKILFAFNSHSLLDWFKIRCCNRAQPEIRSVAWQCLVLCKRTNPDLFANAGPSCCALGYCPEMEQCAEKKGRVPTKEDIKKLKLDENGKPYIAEDNE